MSCPLYIPGSYGSWNSGVEYAIGAIVNNGGATFICINGFNINEIPRESDKWLSTVDIEYNLLKEEWASADLKTYYQFDVVEHDFPSEGLHYWLCLVEHNNSGSSYVLDQAIYWAEINFECLIQDRYPESQALFSTEFAERNTGFRGLVVEYNEDRYAFIDNDGENITETPGTETLVVDGKQWEDVTATAVDTIDYDADNNPTNWSDSTTYSKDDKIYYQEAYYVSVIDRNVNNDPLISDKWALAHVKIPTRTEQNPSTWSAGTYSWGDNVELESDIYLSVEYQNTEQPGTGSSWIIDQLSVVSTCDGIVPLLYNSSTSYSKNFVVIHNFVASQSLIDYNTQQLGNTDAWILCTDGSLSADCSSISVGPWNSNTFYNIGTVVKFVGSYYIAEVANSNSFPYIASDGIWKICKGDTIDCSTLSIGNYNSANTYSIGEVVFYNNAYWIKTFAEASGQEPTERSPHWQLCEKIDFTIETVSKNLYETLIYSESIKFFDSFLDNSSFMYMEVNGKVYSFDNNQNQWVHRNGEFGSFHGEDPQPFIVTIVVNEDVQLRTVYDAIMCRIETNDIKFDEVAVRTNFVDKQTIQKTDHRYKIREGVHTMPARGLKDKNRLRGNWMEVTFKITGKSGRPYEFRYISSDYLKRDSYRR